MTGTTEANEPERSSQRQPMTGGWQTKVHRTGSTVRRTAKPWSTSVMMLLDHLAQTGFTAAPHPIDGGFDVDGNEWLSFVPGESPQPTPWSDEGLDRLGSLVSDLHGALSTFTPPGDAQWQPWFGRSMGQPTGFGHGDLGPWNVMAIDQLPIGFIDWDTAGPIDLVVELAQVAWLNVQLHDDDVGTLVGLGGPERRASQLRVLLDGYGLPSGRRSGFVDRMIEVAVHDASVQAKEHGVGPDTTIGVADDGYPFAWGMAWRIRAASWMLQHRETLERAIT